MNTPKPMFVREVARIDDPRFVSGQVARHRAFRNSCITWPSDQESIVAHENGAGFPEILLGGLIMSELLPVSFKKGRGLCLACLRRTCRVPVQASGHVTTV
jgi:hypothetical protein